MTKRKVTPSQRQASPAQASRPVSSPAKPKPGKPSQTAGRPRSSDSTRRGVGPYRPSGIEARWQARWEKEKAFRAPNPGQQGFDPAKPKYYEDKNESCTLSITRHGTMTFSKNDTTGIWNVVQERYTDLWYAHSMTSDKFIQESSFGGPHEIFTLVHTELPERVPLEETIFNVRDYGAVGDGTTLDSIAINTGIDTCANHGSGMVYFPPGIYLSGSLHLKTNVTLFFDFEAVLRETRDMTKYDPREYNPWEQYQDTSQSYFIEVSFGGRISQMLVFLVQE